MKRMDLSRASTSSTGKEIPGMISLYLVRLSNGGYYQDGGIDALPRSTNDWAQAKFFFAYNGVLEAKEIARKYSGKVCIINCTPVQEYQS